MRLKRLRWPVMPRLTTLKALLLCAALLALGMSLSHLHLPMPRPVFEGIAIVDITQSMDTADMSMHREDALSATAARISRLEFVKQALISALPDLPCGSKFGLGVFTEYRSLLLVMPVEVCANLVELQAAVRNIEGKMAWSGNSEVAKGLYWAMKLAAKEAEKPALIFFTDGQEAPPINASNRLAYQGKVGEVAGVIAGVGGSKAQPIPKRDPLGRQIGYWDATEVSQVNPYGNNSQADPAPDAARAEDLVNRDGAAVSTRRTAATLLGATPGTEHLSALRETYLRVIAGEVGLSYATMRNSNDVSRQFSRSEVSHWRWVRVDASYLFAAIALIALLAYVWLVLELRHLR